MLEGPRPESIGCVSKAERKARSPIRQALAHRDFRYIALGNAVSETGDWLYNVALLVYVFDVTGSAGWVAIASFFRLLPSMVVTPFAGVLADRFERRTVMMWSAGLGAIFMGALAVLAGTTESALGAIALAFLCNAALTPYRPAVAAMTPSILPERNLAAANTLLSAIGFSAIAVGPADWWRPSPYRFAGHRIRFQRPVVPLHDPRPYPRQGTIQSDRGRPAPDLAPTQRGAERYFHQRGREDHRLSLAAASFLYGTELVTFVVYSEQRLGIGADGITYLMAAIGVGGVVGAAFTSRVGNTARPGRLLWLSAFLSGAALIGLAFATEPWMAYTIVSLDGAGALLGEVVCFTLLQRAVPQKVLGRVFGAVDSILISGILIGSLVTPWILSLIGLRPTLLFSGLSLPLLTLLAVGGIRRLDKRSAERKAQLDDLVDLLARSQLMEGAPRQALELVAANLDPLSVPANTDVILQGDEAENLYIIRSGHVDVVKRDATGEVKLATLGSDDFFGEIGVLEQAPRMATVTTTTEAELFKIKGEDFLVALELSSGVAGRLSGTVAERLAEAEGTGRGEAA